MDTGSETEPANALPSSDFSLVEETPLRLREYPNVAQITQGLEQAARTYGFLRSLNPTGAPVHELIDCFTVDVLRHAE